MGLFDFLGPKKKLSPAPNESVPTTGNKKKGSLQKIEIKPGLQIPKELEDLWPEIEKTRLFFNAMEAVKQNDLALEQSKLCHYPCIPAGYDYPKDSEGKYMFPLAQINFREMPALEGFPKSGYLQLYISAFDDVYGMDFDDMQSQKNFRVLFFEEQEVEKYKTDFSFLDEAMASDMPPVTTPHSLTFMQKEEYLGFGDVRYEEMNQSAVVSFLEDNEAIMEELIDSEVFNGSGHKIGGYAYFTQTDPRIDEPKFEEYIQLFQLDSIGDIMWGDVGVGHLFIHPDDLAKKDFSKVVYYFDCC